MKIFLLSLFLTFFVGCYKQTIHSVNTKFPEGRKLYLSKCGGCHRIYDRNEYEPAQWDTIVVSMRTKAKTTVDQEREMLLFLKERD